MEDRESFVPQFSLPEHLKAKLIWLSEQEGIPVDHALDVLLDYYKQLERDTDLNDLHSILRLGKELKLREISAKEVHQYMKLRQALANRDQALNHLEAALEILPALEHAGLTPGSVPETETVHLAARLTASGVTVTEVERWLRHRQRRQRTGASPDSDGAPHA